MPKFRDTVTGQVKEFDHEPTSQELDHEFGLGAGIGEPGSAFSSLQPTAESQKSAVAPGLGGILGAVIGGKTPLGKIGSGIGAAAGTAYGDLYNMFAHGVGDTTPSSEAQRLATVAGLTTAGEAVVPPVLNAIGSIKNILPQGSGVLGGGGLGWMFGHPGVGAGVGAAIEAAPKVAQGVEWLGKPAGAAAGEAASADFMKSVSPSMQGNSGVKSAAAKVGAQAQREAGGAFADVPDYLKQENWGDSLRKAGGYVKDKASAAVEGLQGMLGGGSAAAPPAAPPSPRPAVRVPKSVGDISANAGVTGQPVSSLPDASRDPNLRWSAEVSAAPQRTPQLSQTSPLDPEMPWEELASRQQPKRTSTQGGTFGGAEVGTHPEALNSNKGNSLTMSRTPEEALQGLQTASPAPPVGTHDEGLQRWIEAGGTPETYGAVQSRHPFGPNTVGAAQAKHTYLPKTVNEAKGLSLPEQDAWEGFKAANPGTTDAMLNSWYTSNQMGGNPHEGLDIPGMIDALKNVLAKPKF